MTVVLRSVSTSSFRSPRYRLRSLYSCFGPSISTLMCMYFLFMHSKGDVVHSHKHWPGAMCAALVAERIDSIGARDQHYILLDPSQSPPRSSTPPTGSHQKGDSTSCLFLDHFLQLLPFAASFPHASA